jgi:hypothetical protein
VRARKDILLANHQLAKDAQQEIHVAAAEYCADPQQDAALVKDAVSDQLLAAAFVYDYCHPALRSAQHHTSRFTEARRRLQRERAAAMLLQSVVRAKVITRSKLLDAAHSSSHLSPSSSSSSSAASATATFGSRRSGGQ